MYGTLEEFVTFMQDEEVVDQSNLDSSQLFVNKDYAQIHLDSAAAKITGELAARYALPIAPPPPQLKSIYFRIAHWSMEQPSGIRDAVQTRYEAAIEDLEKLASGDTVLVDAAGAIIQPKATAPDEAADSRLKSKMYTANRSSNVTIPQFGCPKEETLTRWRTRIL